jgi:ABC-2 type transport system ATP-binding protein
MPERCHAIEVRDLVKRYRGARHDALRGVTFEVAEGASLCLVGPNGAGKSTILSILATTMALTEGTVRVMGHDVLTDQALVRRALGVVFQQASLDLNLSAEANLRMHAILYGMFPWRPAYRLMAAAYRRRVAAFAEVFGFADDLHLPARSLSGGMRRRVEIVRALLHDPQVLILDEPTAGLDAETRDIFWAYLGRSRRARCMTIVYTTHLHQEDAHADTVCALSDGRIAAPMLA